MSSSWPCDTSLTDDPESILVEKDEQKQDDRWEELKNQYQEKLSILLSDGNQSTHTGRIILCLQNDSHLKAHVQAIKDTAIWGIEKSILDRATLLRGRGTHDVAAQTAESMGIYHFQELAPSLCSISGFGPPLDVVWERHLLGNNLATDLSELVKNLLC